MGFSDAFDQTLIEFGIKGKEMAARSGLTEAAISEFRRGEREIKSGSLEKLFTALPNDAKQYLFFKLLIGEMDQKGIATLLSAIAYHLKSEKPEFSDTIQPEAVLSLR
jgi:transcriptional regulator with XRE-family HTH domain